MGMLNYEEHIKEHELIALRYPEKAPVLASNGVTAQTNPLTGGVEILAGGKKVDSLSGGADYISTKGSTLYDITNSSNAMAVTACTLAYDRTITRWGNATLKVTPSNATSQFRKGTLAATLD